MSLIWGLTWAAVKIGLEGVPPLLLAAARYLPAAALLAIGVRELSQTLARSRWRRTLVSALLVKTGTYGLLFWALRSVPSGLSGLVNLSLTPVMLFALAAATGEERPTWRHAAALAIGIVGFAALLWNRAGGETSVLGIGAIVLATACYCLGSVVARPLLREVGAL